LRFVARLGQIVGAVQFEFDVRREVQSMFAHEPLGEVGIAVLERVDDAVVIFDRTLEAPIL